MGNLKCKWTSVSPMNREAHSHCYRVLILQKEAPSSTLVSLMLRRYFRTIPLKLWIDSNSGQLYLDVRSNSGKLHLDVHFLSAEVNLVRWKPSRHC
jgi:hypothetical protein